ncbi:MAG: ABC transporter substrate-binding protein [Alphaproteobacteria bacterium]|nr:ABC transporter substrate-binding protein [Alphaproteobacteria bacterium]
MTDKLHPYVTAAGREMADGKLDRREFLRVATLLGVGASAAYSMAGLSMPAMAQGAPRKGGTVRLGMRVQDLSNPATYSWIESANAARQVVEYLTITGVDNVTRPNLIEKWEASPDLKSWKMSLRKDVKWRKGGRNFTADDAIWNLKRHLDPATGSSTVGLLRAFILENYELDEIDPKTQKKKVSARLWDANAIRKVDDFTFEINGKIPNLGIPEAMFHYPLLMLDPAEGGKFGVGSNGTGAYDMVELEVGKRAVFTARKDGYWGQGPWIDRLEIVDLGDDAAAQVSALASKQVDMIYQGAVSTLPTVERLPHVQVNMVDTGYTAVARVQPVKPFDDKRVRQALRYATDTEAVLKAAHRGLGKPGEHHHVSPAHPEYANIGFMKRDVAKAKALLAEAGFPNGLDTEIACRPQPDWELLAVQTMVEQWKEAGLRVKINVMPSAQYWDVWTKVPFGFTTWAHRPLGVMVLGLAYRTGAAWNESNWSNKEFDALLAEAEGYLDVEKRRAVMAKIEQIMLDDGPAVVPVWRAVFNYTDKKIKGYKIHPSIYIDFKDVWLEG